MKFFILIKKTTFMSFEDEMISNSFFPIHRMNKNFHLNLYQNFKFLLFLIVLTIDALDNDRYIN